MHCQSCPLKMIGPCPGEHHIPLCDHVVGPDGPRYRAMLLSRGQPKEPYRKVRMLEVIPGRFGPPPKPIVDYFPFKATPGRVRVGIVSPCDGLGGAERWMVDLLEQTDNSRLAWIGVAVRNGFVTGTSFRHDWLKHCPVESGEDAIRALAMTVDVLVTWGVVNVPWGIVPSVFDSMVPAGLPIINVSQGAMGYPGMHEGSIPRMAYVAVSKASLIDVPPDKRASARIIHNIASEARIVSEPGARQRLRKKWGIPDGAKVLGYLGRFSPEKGPHHFIDATAALPDDWYGVMVGSGWDEAKSRARAANVGKGRIVFAGPMDDVGNALAAFDRMFMPSDSEGCSLAAVEAMLKRVPMLSTPVGVFAKDDRPDLVRIIPHGSMPAEMASAILADFADVEGTKARVEVAREYAATECSPEVFNRDWTGLILEKSGPVVGLELCYCGDDIWIGSAKACLQQHAKFDRVIHIYRDDYGGLPCPNHDYGANSMIVHWREWEPIEPLELMRPTIDKVIEFAKVPGKLLVHCAGGVTRSPTLALAAKIARGCEPEKAVADIRASYIRERDNVVHWHEHLVPEIIKAAFNPPMMIKRPPPVEPSHVLVPLKRTIELLKLRRDCPHGTKPPGCGCQDMLACSKAGGQLMTRAQCYECLEGAS